VTPSPLFRSNRFLILVSFLLLISAIPLRANTTTDPNIGLDDPPCIEGCPVPGFTPVSGALGTSFTFNADGSGGGISFFEVNPSGPGFSTLDIETPVGYVPDSVNCTITSSTSAFNNCTVRNLDGVTDIYFSNIVLLTALLTTTDPGLPAGGSGRVVEHRPNPCLGEDAPVRGEPRALEREHEA